jgi:hypothetical protein
LRSLFRLVQARLEVSRKSSPELLRRLRSNSFGRPSRDSIVDVDLMRWALQAVSRRLPWRSDCLVQSLAARLWLDAAGVPCSFRLGASRLGDEIGAHAWIEVDGKVASGGQSVARLRPFTLSEDAAAR